jgi:hypothetical protein
MSMDLNDFVPNSDELIQLSTQLAKKYGSEMLTVTYPCLSALNQDMFQAATLDKACFLDRIPLEESPNKTSGHGEMIPRSFLIVMFRQFQRSFPGLKYSLLEEWFPAQNDVKIQTGDTQGLAIVSFRRLMPTWFCIKDIPKLSTTLRVVKDLRLKDVHDMLLPMDPGYQYTNYACHFLESKKTIDMQETSASAAAGARFSYNIKYVELALKANDNLGISEHSTEARYASYSGSDEDALANPDAKRAKRPVGYYRYEELGISEEIQSAVNEYAAPMCSSRRKNTPKKNESASKTDETIDQRKHVEILECQAGNLECRKCDYCRKWRCLDEDVHFVLPAVVDGVKQKFECHLLLYSTGEPVGLSCDHMEQLMRPPNPNDTYALDPIANTNNIRKFWDWAEKAYQGDYNGFGKGDIVFLKDFYWQYLDWIGLLYPEGLVERPLVDREIPELLQKDVVKEDRDRIYWGVYDDDEPYPMVS